jgi:hypothetical protein
LSLSVCPIALVHASADSVWALLAHPISYAKWWDATTDRIVPAGPVQPGQLITAHARAIGMAWPIKLEVEAVDASRRELTLTTSLPLGITIINHISVRPVDAGTARVSFG